MSYAFKVAWKGNTVFMSLCTECTYFSKGWLHMPILLQVMSLCLCRYHTRRRILISDHVPLMSLHFRREAVRLWRTRMWESVQFRSSSLESQENAHGHPTTSMFCVPEEVSFKFLGFYIGNLWTIMIPSIDVEFWCCRLICSDSKKCKM